jgi:GAF domain
MDDAATSSRSTDLAERLLEHRLAQPDLTTSAGSAALRAAFRTLAKVFALQHAVAAGEPPREILAIVADGLAEAVQASGRIVLTSAQGELVVARTAEGDPFAGDPLAALTAPVIAEGRPRIVDVVAGERRLSLACAPLRRLDGEIVGAVQLFDKRQAAFDDADLALAMLIGTTLAELAVTAGLLPWLTEGGRLVPRSGAELEGGDASGREHPVAHPRRRARHPHRRSRLDPALRSGDRRALHDTVARHRQPAAPHRRQ